MVVVVVDFFVSCMREKVRRIIPRLRVFIDVLMEISSRVPVPLFQAQNQSTLALRAGMAVDERLWRSKI